MKLAGLARQTCHLPGEPGCECGGGPAYTHILQTADHRVRDSAHKYQHLPAKKSALANSFYNRTVRNWNILKVKLAPSPAAFKARLLQSS